MAIPAGFNIGQVVYQHQWTESLFSIRIQVPKTFYFAGQFTKLALFEPDGDLIRRAYSIVNHPDDHAKTNELEFLIITDTMGQLSPKLHQLTIGDEVLVGQEGAGFMTLAEIPQSTQELWLLSTGTAIGPFLSMLEDDSIIDRFKKIVLVNAVRYQNELSYQSLIQRLKYHYKERFHYVPIVSRESVSGALSGRVPELLKSGILQTRVNSSLSHEKSFFYLCGNPEMVRDTSTTLKELGYSKHLRSKSGQYSSENYW